jgi:two-component system chemotaxis response regulator CheY
MKILVVDDSRAMRMIVQRTLRQAGFDATIVEAENGQEALDKTTSEKPDLILSDWNMPVMSGIEFLNALREAGNNTKFGFVTSESTPAMRAQAVGSGAAFLISKPFNADTFKETLNGVA